MAKTYLKKYYSNTFRLQCLDVDPLTMDQFDRSVESVGKILEKDPAFLTSKHIIGTGCGDSILATAVCRDACAYYLPDVTFEAIVALELSRFYNMEACDKNTIIVAASVSGGINRTNECLARGNKNGLVTVAMTDNAESKSAKTAKILYHVNSPVGDNNAGNRTYFVNILSFIILMAAMAELRTGRSYLPELREQVKKYHDAFFAEFEAMDDFLFKKAFEWKEKKFFEIVADNALFWSARFISAKLAEVPGDLCSVVDSENYMHVNSIMYPGSWFGEMNMICSYENNVSRIADTINNQVKRNGRDVLVFADKAPEELGITEKVDYLHVPVPEKEWHFLLPLYSYLPGSLFAAYRAAVLGEPFFRGGFDFEVFEHSYFSPEVII